MTKEPRRWIRPLPERLVNKIAAGEVVERPAAVVKELVENALDAGADRIEISAEKSGVKLIRIVDNGCGIPEDQIEIAFSRHATSKISEFSDLDRITSYGFRGEALPSIASVSRMRMVSRTADEESGSEIIYEGGVLQSKQPIAAPPGTTIEVGDLFFNTPARRKFLKAESTEARYISRTAMAMAMGRYQIGFTYNLNGRKVFSLPSGSDLMQRVTSLLSPGKVFIPIEGEMGPLRLSGCIGRPDMVQSNRMGQYIFINGRYIQSPMLAHALAAGYGELLPKGNFPIGAILITLDASEVDVNVHPAKTEVRLSRDREIHDALYRLVKEGLRQGGIAPTLRVAGFGDMASSPGAGPSSIPSSGQEQPWNQSQSNKIAGITGGRPANTDMLADMYREISPSGGAGISAELQVDKTTGEITEAEAELSTRPDSTGSKPALRLVGRFSDLYLIVQAGDELLIVDQHTAHERLLFEETLRQMDDQSGVGQHLLLPVQVELSPEQMALIEEAKAEFGTCGYVVAPFGGNTVRIEAVPAILSRKSPEKSLLKILDDIGSLKKTGYGLKKAIAQSIACRSAVMAGDRLSDPEALALVNGLFGCENIHSCPHGRPTFIKLSRAELDRQFGRG